MGLTSCFQSGRGHTPPPLHFSEFVCVEPAASRSGLHTSLERPAEQLDVAYFQPLWTHQMQHRQHVVFDSLTVRDSSTSSSSNNVPHEERSSKKSYKIKFRKKNP